MTGPDGREDSGGGRPTERDERSGPTVHPAGEAEGELLLPGFFPSLENPVEIGANGRPTGVELEEPADEEGAGAGSGEAADVGGHTAPFRPEDIKFETQAPTVDLLLSRLKKQLVDLAPDFQRRTGIWSDVRQSRLIESMLLGIPISAFHMAQDEADKWSVVDGAQRLTAIARFMAADTVGMPPLVLQGLEYLRDLDGMGYPDLPGRLRIRLRETPLTVHIIHQGAPDAVKFNVFVRMNTGRARQEIRHAMVKGPARRLLADLAEDATFGEATGWSVSNERMADRELVLRFLAFRLSDPFGYRRRDFEQFLVEAMHRINRLGEEQRDAEARAFRESMKTARELFGEHAFRKWRGQSRKSPINKALFESVAVNLATLDDREREALVASRDEVQQLFFDLMKDWDFDRAISIATGDPNKVRTRFEALRKLFQGVLNGD